MASSEDFHVPSSKAGHRLAVSLYKPHTSVDGKPPIIVMGHGIGGIKAAGLEPFATAFASAGYAALTLDYLHFGESDGQPRNVMSVAQELQDFRDVISWVRTQPDQFDINKIVAWGSSFGGMHVTALVSEDHELAGGIAQVPCVDGWAASMKAPLGLKIRSISIALLDWASSFVRSEPIYVALIGPDDSSDIALMRGAEAMTGWDRITPTDVPVSNRIAARSLLSIISSRPVLQVHRSTKPLLVVLPAWDHQAPLEEAKKAASMAPLGEVVRLEGGHFDGYKGGCSFEKNLNGQLAFLARILS